MRSVLHVGHGGDALPPWLLPARETTLDIAPECNPDIVASMLDMGDIGKYDVVYTAHTLEHVYPHQVNTALSECLRVLEDGGTFIVFVPNLESVRPTEDVLYHSPAGPVTGLDMIYGARWLIKNMPFMAHHTGFIPETLFAALEAAGFRDVQVKPIGDYNLMGIARK